MFTTNKEEPIMFTKTIREKSGDKTIFCYDRVPENQSEEMQVVFNTCLKIANDFRSPLKIPSPKHEDMV